MFYYEILPQTDEQYNRREFTVVGPLPGIVKESGRYLQRIEGKTVAILETQEILEVPYTLLPLRTDRREILDKEPKATDLVKTPEQGCAIGTRSKHRCSNLDCVGYDPTK